MTPFISWVFFGGIDLYPIIGIGILNIGFIGISNIPNTPNKLEILMYLLGYWFWITDNTKTIANTKKHKKPSIV